MLDTLEKAADRLLQQRQAQQRRRATAETSLLSASPTRRYGATAASEAKQDELQQLHATLVDPKTDYIVKVATVCLFVQQASHDKDTDSYQLLLILNSSKCLTTVESEYCQTGKPLENWPGHLKAIWFDHIQKSIISHTCDTNLRDHRRETALRSGEGLTFAEQTCLANCKHGPHVHFKIDEHVFDCGQR